MRIRRFLLPAGMVAALALALSSAEAAPPGTLDPSFGHHGVVTTRFGGGGDGSRAVALQTDGKIVIVGVSKVGFAVQRYLHNGAPDPTFGPNGNGTVKTAVGSGSGATSVLMQPDGKIIAAGSADTGTTENPDFALVRYRPNGTLDSTFGDGGKVTTDFSQRGDAVFGLSLEPGGKILAAGFSLQPPSEFEVALARYNPDGSLDQTFGDHGTVSTSAPVVPWGFAFQPDGKVIVSGSAVGNAFGITRLNADGSLDRGFGADGLASVHLGKGSYTTGVALEPDGKIVVDGNGQAGSRQVFALAQFTSTGSVDSSFGQQGSVVTRIAGSAGAESLALDARGRIVAVGWDLDAGSGAFAVARYLPDGSLDTSFGFRGVKRSSFGKGDAQARAVAIQPNGRIVVTGSRFVARYLASTHDLICTVPRVEGKRLATARRAIRHGHCRVGRIRAVFSTRVAGGRVIAQRPRPGALRAPGAPVKLKVSKGQRTHRR